MGNEIPTSARLAVDARDMHTCMACGSGNGTHKHHRRSRRVRDQHTHCTCVLLTLCATCHIMVHAQPAWAMTRGLIVSIHVTEPWTAPVRTFGGWSLMDCHGAETPTDPPAGGPTP